MEFLTFKRYTDKTDLKIVCDKLKTNSIVFEIEDNTGSLDSNFGNTEFSVNYVLKIRQVDFEKANNIIEQLTENQLLTINKDHFLFDFSNEELIDVIKKRDEWGDDNYVLAKNILKERGNNLDPEFIKDLELERIKELSKPQDGNETLGKVIGYISAILGGPLGLLIGYYLLNFKKTLPNGESVYYYSEELRKHGRIIIFIGLLSSLFWLTFRLLKL